jgi:squalene cyclase
MHSSICQFVNSPIRSLFAASPRRRVAASILLASGFWLLAPSPARAANDSSTIAGTAPIKDEITSDLRDHIHKGLDWLKNNISNENTLNAGGGDSAGIMALAGLAFMADGSMPDDGPYGKQVEKILDYVLKNCQESGLITSPNYGSPMYGHGFATLFLAEVYGMTQRSDVKEKLQKAIRLIVQTQNKEGGWRYQPVPNDADISVTICQVMALRAARNAGIKVPKSTIDRAIDYVKKSQEPDGGFSYMLQSRGSQFPRSAAGVACLFYSGIYEGKEIDKGVKYLKAWLPGGRNSAEYHFYYGNYYATQAMFMAGGDAWEKYWPALKTEMIKRQQADGRWTGEVGDVYATSMALIALQVPNRLLPIFQK